MTLEAIVSDLAFTGRMPLSSCAQCGMNPQRNMARPRPCPPAFVPMTGSCWDGAMLYRATRAGICARRNRSAMKRPSVYRVKRAHTADPPPEIPRLSAWLPGEPLRTGVDDFAVSELHVGGPACVRVAESDSSVHPR